MTRRKSGHEYGRRVFIWEHGRPMARLYGPVVSIHADRDGYPVLKSESSWRTACGVRLSGKTWRWTFQFRRFSK